MADRRPFWPVVLLGVAGAGLGAYAGSRDWVAGRAAAGQDLTNPATTSLALVALAAWGVVLVTRGWMRRAVAALGALASLAPIPGMWGSTHHLLRTHPATHVTAWPWIAAAVLIASWAAGVLAVLWAPSWPEMGRKYDAPTASTAPDADDNTALWRELSEGRDPTDGPSA